ncbi:hypothetical protein KCP77_23295 [Salmonella enterica subsp. enterica]|nr:hypothetical protein KCP77_23295 [Salmonella enterica subsp. enterica]
MADITAPPRDGRHRRYRCRCRVVCRNPVSDIKVTAQPVLKLLPRAKSQRTILNFPIAQALFVRHRPARSVVPLFFRTSRWCYWRGPGDGRREAGAVATGAQKVSPGPVFISHRPSDTGLFVIRPPTQTPLPSK